MENKEVMAGNNIPEDLWPEILSRLPVKSLLRFRCVSKSWKSLIADPDFCQSHFNSFKNNREETHLLCVQVGATNRHDYVLRCSNTFETTAVLPIRWECTDQWMTTFHTSDYPGIWVIEGFANGLCLLKDSKRGSMLWNPSIRKFKSIPPSPEISDEMRSIQLGIGFDPLNKDHKLVRLVCHCNDVNSVDNSVDSVAVYSITTGSWKVIQFPGKQWPDLHWSASYCRAVHGSKPLNFLGYMCFIAESVDVGTALLVSFDLRREVFASIPMPKDWDYEEIRAVNGKCSWLKYDSETGEGSLWVLEGCGRDFESMCWKQGRSFSIRIPTFGIETPPFSRRIPPLLMHILKNGDMLLKNFKGMRFNVETLEMKILEDDNGYQYYPFNLYEYNESLILLE